MTKFSQLLFTLLIDKISFTMFQSFHPITLIFFPIGKIKDTLSMKLIGKKLSFINRTILIEIYSDSILITFTVQSFVSSTVAKVVYSSTFFSIVHKFPFIAISIHIETGSLALSYTIFPSSNILSLIRVSHHALSLFLTILINFTFIKSVSIIIDLYNRFLRFFSGYRCF